MYNTNKYEFPKAWSGDDGVWPPVWKGVTEYWLIELFLRLEADDFGYTPGAKYHDRVSRFIRQVRESRGYDVDCTPPMRSPFSPVTMEHVIGCKSMSRFVRAEIEFVMGEINPRAEMHGEMYVFDKLEKVVDACRYRVQFLSFSVKEVVPNPDVVKTVQAMVYYVGNSCFELHNWRFKPQQLAATSTNKETSTSSDLSITT